MSFQPVLPTGGLVGWQFLQRTLDAQQESFARAPDRKRDTDYFRERIATIATPAELVADRRLMRVALGAFGLQDDINNRFFIRKMLEEGTRDPGALANRLADKRYAAFVTAFDFGSGASERLADPTFADRVVQGFQRQAFEVAVGDQDETLRLAMTLERELPQLLDRVSGEDARWLTVLGTPPLRKAFQGALGLPSAMASLDLDQQVRIFRDRARSLFGDGALAQFAEPERREALTQRFLLMAQVQEMREQTSPASVALFLLQGASGAQR